MNYSVSKFIVVLLSVLPIVVFVTVLNFTISPIGTQLFFRFLVGSAFVLFGLTFFLLGIDIGISPFGSIVGATIAKKNKFWVVIVLGLLVGFFIAIAEPGLLVFANQVSDITLGQISSSILLIVVSIGIAIMLIIGLFRIVYNVPIYVLLIILYAIIFVLGLFTSGEFLAIAFDSAGAVTGMLVVPFILSISAGMAHLKRNHKDSDNDSFGLLAIVLTGAIISVMILGLLSKNIDFVSIELGDKVISSNSIMGSFGRIIPRILLTSFIAILPLPIILLAFNKILFKIKKRKLKKLITGFIFSFIGLFLFLLGANGSFMDVGMGIGYNLANLDREIFLIVIGFVLGATIILAEPAVYVLTHQIEEVTSGSIRRKVVLVSLTVGVGLAVALSAIRIVIPAIQLWHFLLPGYLICLIMMFFIPKMFVGISFDAGVVATGPMTVTFLLAFMQGAAYAYDGSDVLTDGLGMIAMVAMVTILVLEVMGLFLSIKLKLKLRGTKGGVKDGNK